MKPIIFGLTGSIGCGKSTVTKYLRAAGVAVVDADIVAREVVVPGSEGLRQIVEAFGEQYLNEDGTLNRIKFGNYVFANRAELTRCDVIMKPLVFNEAMRQIKAFVDQGETLVAYDCALIIEQNITDMFRPLVVVTTPVDVQMSRIMKRNSLTEEQARDRISKQLSSAEKAKHADFIIETTGTLEELEVKVKQVLASIKERNNHGAL